LPDRGGFYWAGKSPPRVLPQFSTVEIALEMTSRMPKPGPDQAQDIANKRERANPNLSKIFHIVLKYSVEYVLKAMVYICTHTRGNMPV
jgi:hypothetical protein